MNEKFGFLSNFPGIKLNLKKKSPVLIAASGELTDNPPPINNNEAYLTEDESDEDEPEKINNLFNAKPITQPVNRIFESSSSSGKAFEPNATSSKQRRSSEPSIKSGEMPSPSKNSKLADTIIGGFSDDELSSRLSIMTFKDQPQRSIRGQVKKTLTGRFSDLSEKEEPPAIVSNKPANQLADTIIQSSSSDEEDPPIVFYKKPLVPLVVNKSTPRTPKPSLPDTIIGFSESMSKTSVQEPVEAIDEDQENEQEVEGSEEASEYDEEVITVLDSDEENKEDSLINHPPIINSTESFHNCSSTGISKPQSADSDTTVNKFFNNIPLITSPQRLITLSAIRRHNDLPNEEPSVERPKTTTERESIDRFIATGGTETQGNSFEADVVLEETDVSELHQTNEKLDTSNFDNSDNQESSEIVRRSEVGPPESDNQILTEQTVSNLTQSSTVFEQINISTNININLKISMRHSNSTDTSECSSTDASSSSSSSDDSPSPPSPKPKEKTRQPSSNQKTNSNPPRKQTPKTAPPKKNHSTRKEKQTVAPGDRRKSNLKDISNPLALIKPPALTEQDFRTPTKADDIAIDDDLQEALNSIYGNSWKTPQLLLSCRSKTVRQDLRKSIHAKNFDSFVKNLSNDLESTRITPRLNGSGSKFEPLDVRRSWKKKQLTTPQEAKPTDKGSSNKKPESSNKKTPRLVVVSDDSDFESPAVLKDKRRAVKKTPKYLDICDSDTPSDNDTDSDFEGNDTWNASSDEEYENEQERIKKRSIARKSRKDGEIIFIPDKTIDELQKKVDDLDRFEYKKPPGMLTPRIAKKKLFTHSHFDDDTPPPEDETPKEKENKEPQVNLRDVFFRSPFPVPKKAMEVKKPSPSPKTVHKTPKSTSKAAVKAGNVKLFSFLKSLDVEANPMLCDPDAYAFRKNFKTKKNELTEILFKLYNEKVFNGKLSDVPVKWNKKLLNTAGRCNNSRRNGVRHSQIDLSDKVLTSSDRLRCTLIHEMCHAATWILNGDNGHGPTWKCYAMSANKTFPELPKISVCHSYEIEYKYTYQCKNCQGKYQTHSKCKKVELIRCSICKGPIELFLNKKDKNGQVVMTPVSKDVKGFAKFVQMNFKDVKQPTMSHKEVMQILSARYAALSVDEKKNL